MMSLSLRGSLIGLLLASGLWMACGSEDDSGFQDVGDDDASAPSSSNGGISSGNNGDGGQGDGGSSSGGPSCASATAEAAREPVYLHVVLDRSQSMDGHGAVSGNTCDTRQPVPDGASVCFHANAREPDPLAPDREHVVCHAQDQTIADCPAFRGLTGKKWLAARGALVSFFDQAEASADDRIGVGMFLFDGRTQNDSEWMVAPGMVDGAQADALRATVLPPEFATAGGTPLRKALTSQSRLLRDYQPASPLQPNGKRVLVLMTDGTPSDCGTNRADCVNDVAALLTGETPITTFVIGVGPVDADESSVYDEKFLSRLANAGGAATEGCNPDWDGQNPNGTVPCHFQVTPGERTAAQIEADMRAAITEIAARVQSCELTLVQTSEMDTSKVNVVYTAGDGAQSQIAADASNGWTFDDPNAPTKVILNGNACTQLKADVDASVQIVIGCPTGTNVVH